MVNFQQDSSFEERKAGGGGSAGSETTAGTAAHIKLSGGKWLMSHGGNDGPWSARNLGIQLFFSTRIRCCCCASKKQLHPAVSTAATTDENRRQVEVLKSSDVFVCWDWKMNGFSAVVETSLIPTTRQPWLWRIGDICWNKHNLYWYSFSFMLSSKVWILSPTGARGYNFSW